MLCCNLVFRAYYFVRHGDAFICVLKTYPFVFLFLSSLLLVNKDHDNGMLFVQLLGNQQMFGRIQEENCGSVSMSLRYDSEQSLLAVRIVRAHELLPREGQSGMDPYCRLRLLPDRRHQLHSKVVISAYTHEYVLFLHRIFQFLFFLSFFLSFSFPSTGSAISQRILIGSF